MVFILSAPLMIEKQDGKCRFYGEVSVKKGTLNKKIIADVPDVEMYHPKDQKSKC